MAAVGGFRKGANIQVWSESEGRWLEGSIEETYDRKVVTDGFEVPAGCIKVSSSAGVKYLMPEQTSVMLRHAPGTQQRETMKSHSAGSRQAGQESSHHKSYNISVPTLEGFEYMMREANFRKGMVLGVVIGILGGLVIGPIIRLVLTWVVVVVAVIGGTLVIFTFLQANQSEARARGVLLVDDDDVESGEIEDEDSSTDCEKMKRRGMCS